MYYCSCDYTVLLDIFLEANLLDYRMKTCSTLVDNAKDFPKRLYQFTFQIAMSDIFHYSTSSILEIY